MIFEGKKNQFFFGLGLTRAGKGYPDITLFEPIADAFSISVTELISGNTVYNSNVSTNMMKSKFYICPICGNIIHSMGEAVINCHGVLMTSAESSDSLQMVKLYPEGNAETRFKINGVKRILFYCNRDGLFYIDTVK